MADVTRRERLSLAAARRLALGAQGLAKAPPMPDEAPAPGAGHVRRAVGRLGLVQVDSVSAVVRSHYLPLFSRLGAYPREHLERIAWGPRRARALFEYWGHECSLMPFALQPLMRWRMARAERGEGIYGGLARFGAERRPFIDSVLAEVRDRGPLAASELSDAGPSRGPWWGWSDGKRALEWLFWAGLVTTATRRGFERVYDLPERVLPPDVLAVPTPAAEEAQRGLLRLAARALGVGTASDLCDYFRLDVPEGRRRVAELVEEGGLVPVEVEGWRHPAYADPGAVVPRRAEGRALLSPFDSLIWERPRAERLFGFRFRLEIYTPAHKREHGYYVLPLLLGDRIVARVDVRSDRAKGRLLALAAHAEAHAQGPACAAALAAELRRLAGWLGLDRVEVGERGDLAAALLGEGRAGGDVPIVALTDRQAVAEVGTPGPDAELEVS